jgi:hypothetical protein
MTGNAYACVGFELLLLPGWRSTSTLVLQSAPWPERFV